MVKKTAIVAAALFSSLSAFASTNLVVDGSFEDQNQGAGSWALYNSINGWTASVGQIEIRNGLAGNAQDGVNFVELDANYNSTMVQSFATVVGQTYSLSFWYSSRPYGPYNTAVPDFTVPADSNGLSFNVGAGDVNVYTPTANLTNDNVWQQYTTTFVATGALTTLSFSATGTSDSYGTSLDNVAVSAVPEPGSLALMLAGLGVVGGLARRRAAR